MTDVLSQNEIDQLLNAISAGQTTIERADAAVERRKIRIYDFKRQDKLSKDQVRILSNIHEIFSRLATTSLSAQLRSLCQVHVASVDQLTFEEFTRSVPNPTTLAVIQLDPLKGSAILEIDPAVSFSIIDRMFGGKGEGGKLTRELTDIEQSAIEGIIVRLLGNLREAWSSVIELRPRLEQIESNPQFAQIIPHSEMVILVTMEIRAGNAEGMMNFCIPYIALESIAGKLSSQYLYSSVRRGSTTENTTALLARMEEIELDVVAEVGRLDVSLREVLDLRRGDVIRLHKAGVREAMVLRIGNRKKFHCRPGVVGSRMAAQLTRKLEDTVSAELVELAAAETSIPWNLSQAHTRAGMSRTPAAINAVAARASPPSVRCPGYTTRRREASAPRCALRALRTYRKAARPASARNTEPKTIRERSTDSAPHRSSPCAKEMNSPFTRPMLPKKIRMPRATINAPLAILIAPMCLRSRAACREKKPKKAPARRNGTPKPSEYTARREIPRAMVPEEPARKRMEARIGPTHGVQPAPNARPRSSEPNRPRGFSR